MYLHAPIIMWSATHVQYLISVIISSHVVCVVFGVQVLLLIDLWSLH